MFSIKTYEVWRVGDDHSGYPILITSNRDKAYNLFMQGGYEIREYFAYPII